MTSNDLDLRQLVKTIDSAEPTEQAKPVNRLRNLEISNAKRKNAELGKLNELDGIECDICKNKGFIYCVPEDSDTMVRKNCECKKQRDIFWNKEKSGLGHLKDKRLNEFKVNNDIQKAMRAMAVEYLTLDKYQDIKPWLFIGGQSGSGKTHIASAICNELLNRGYVVKYVVWTDFMDKVKQEFKRRDDDILGILQSCKECEVLFIDDLFKARTTEFDIQKAFELINARYSQQRITVVTTELNDQQLYSIDSAIMGRIIEKCYVDKGKHGLSRDYRFDMSIDRNDTYNYRLKQR